MVKSVIIRDVSKRYKIYNKPHERVLDLISPKSHGDDFYALRNINFEADEGDVVGIIGVNGSGKSTLSNIIAGIVPPTSGTVEVNGDASLIAIASGLNNELTGRENIELKCLMLGFNKKEIRQLESGIVDFAEIGRFINQPVKSYSSGMRSRLGFAISININPRILVIDEALSVGDPAFADKCMDKMNSFKAEGKTIFFISHAIGQVNKFCQKALWLEFGEVKAYGTTGDIIPQYQRFLKEYKRMSPDEKHAYKEQALRKQGQHQEMKNRNVSGG